MCCSSLRFHHALSALSGGECPDPFMHRSLENGTDGSRAAHDSHCDYGGMYLRALPGACSVDDVLPTASLRNMAMMF